MAAHFDYLVTEEEHAYHIRSYHIMFQNTKLDLYCTENGSRHLTLMFIDAIACWLIVWAGVAGVLFAAGAIIFHFWRKKTL